MPVTFTAQGNNGMDKPSLVALERLFFDLQNFNHLALPSIPFQFRSRLPVVTGIYVLYLGTDVFYVGQSENIRNRWKGHHIHDKLALASEVLVNPDLRLGWIEVSKPLLSFAEIYLIGLLHPVLNVTHRESYTPE